MTGAQPAKRTTNAPAPRLLQTVVLVGMMGSGKSAIGRALAARLGVPHLDSDAAIEEAAQITIAEIFERDGEEFFRRREREVIARLLSGPPAIMSTGGGAFIQPQTREIIDRGGVSLWLDADMTTLWERVRHKSTRPLLHGDNPRGRLQEFYDARVPVYRLAEVHVPSRLGSSIDQTVDRVLEALHKVPGVLEPANG